MLAFFAFFVTHGHCVIKLANMLLLTVVTIATGELSGWGGSMRKRTCVAFLAEPGVPMFTRFILLSRLRFCVFKGHSMSKTTVVAVLTTLGVQGIPIFAFGVHLVDIYQMNVRTHVLAQVYSVITH